MSKNKFIDCITFFDNNFMFQIRYNVLVNYVDYFVIVESTYNHNGERRELKFDLNKYQKFKKMTFCMKKNLTTVS